ncbi:MAG: hypothetical protein V3Q69_12300 [Burkholderia sp.]
MPVTVVENGSKTVATTADRLPRMRSIGRCCINQVRGRNGIHGHIDHEFRIKNFRRYERIADERGPQSVRIA